MAAAICLFVCIAAGAVVLVMEIVDRWDSRR